MEDDLLSLKWKYHNTTFTKEISQYREQALYSDVTLACNGKYFYAHKIILSSCSEYFQEIFTMTQCKQPVIVLKDIRSVDVEQLLQYIYMGEVEVKQTELSELVKAAEYLKIKGLINLDDYKEVEIIKKSKRKLSDETLDSPQKQSKSSPSNIHNDKSKNQTSQNTNLNKKDEFVKAEPDDLDIIINEEISKNCELDNLEDSSMNYEEKEITYVENEPQNENLELSNHGIPIEYVPESLAGPSLLNETRNSEDLDGCIIRKNEYFTVYSCTLCQFCTPVKTNFLTHYRKHTGEKPFKCQYCNYRTAQKQDVRKHEKIHTGEKPYSCHHCPYRAGRKQHLRNHVMSKHNK